MNDKFEPRKQQCTIVYDSQGNEIDRLDGFVDIHPQDYIEHLPIEYAHILMITQIVNCVKIEPK